jgi:hypothetical protein
MISESYHVVDNKLNDMIVMIDTERICLDRGMGSFLLPVSRRRRTISLKVATSFIYILQEGVEIELPVVPPVCLYHMSH